MGRKRKYSSSDDVYEMKKIKKKLKKLQKEVKKSRKHRKSRKETSSSSSSSSSSDYDKRRERRSASYDRNGSSQKTRYYSESSLSPHGRRSSSIQSVRSDTGIRTPPSEVQTAPEKKADEGKEKDPPSEVRTNLEKKANEEKGLSEDLLNVIGKRVYEEKSWSDPIQPEIARRWEDILKKGLPKEEREKIFKKYSVPKNCPLSEPPKLNPEIKSIIQEAVQNRDSRIVLKQSKITSSLSAIGKTMSLVLENLESEKDMSILECLGDVSSLLADLQHDESIIRRSLILANINPSLKETLAETNVDSLLFSDKLDEVLKSAKVLAAVSKDLCPVNNKNNHSKNSKAPPRQQKKYAQTPGGQKQNQRQQPHYQNSKYQSQRYQNHPRKVPQNSQRGRR